MKHTLIFLLLLAVCAHAYSVVPPPTRGESRSSMASFESQCMMSTGVSYTPFLYTPFDGRLPSEYAVYAAMGSADGDDVPTGRREGFIDRPDTGRAPLGAPWCLVVFAAWLAIWRVVRNRRAESLDMNKSEKII